VSPHATILALGATLLLLPVTACYQGPPDPEGAPWEGRDSDADGEGAGTGDGDGGASGAVTAGGSSGGASSPADGSGDGNPADGGPADDGTDGGADGNPADGGDMGDSGPPSADVPDNAYCDEVASWDPQWAQLEVEILAIVNEVRGQGANCGSAGSFGPAGPVSMQPALRCAARKHSKDMADRNFFDHTNPSGESPWDRMGQAGYSYSTAGENIAAGNSTASATMDQWMNSDGHCGNIMNPDFDEIGVGYYPGGQYGHLWTQAFGSP
jgi:uncharacterized protein YkwD